VYEEFDGSSPNHTEADRCQGAQDEEHRRGDRERMVLGRIDQQDDAVDPQADRKEERALSEPI
jgi:hypothetical protein